ncbi:hypothetical protein [Cryobacterium sp. MP_3.1]|uniref:hypothetical protein n=1 Tax=Cryobacterium sp. MP_3.1 TaxID=3071711 RepID=UPI002E0F57E9
MARRTSPLNLDFGLQLLLWGAFIVVGVALAYIQIVVIKTAFNTQAVDSFSVLAIAFSAIGVRMMFLFLKWFKNPWIHVLSLATGSLIFIAAFVSLFASADVTKKAVIPLLAALGTCALLAGIVINVLDTRGLQPSVWIWQERTWWDRKVDSEADARRILESTLAKSIETLETGAAFKRRKGARLVAAADEAAARQIKMLLHPVQRPYKSSTRTVKWLATIVLLAYGVSVGRQLRAPREP